MSIVDHERAAHPEPAVRRSGGPAYQRRSEPDVNSGVVQPRSASCGTAGAMPSIHAAGEPVVGVTITACTPSFA